MKTHKFLSLVITAHNQAASIGEILANIPDEIPDVEVVVIDDVSDVEEQFRLMQHVSDFHVRTGEGRYEFFAKHRWCGGARNRGVGLSTADYVWFIDGDDRLAPNAIERVLQRLKFDDGKFDYYSLGYDIVNPDGTIEGSVQYNSGFDIYEVDCMAWSKVIRRESFVKFRQDMMEDVDWWFRTLAGSVTPPSFTALSGIYYKYNKMTFGSVTAPLAEFWENGKSDQPKKTAHMLRTGSPRFMTTIAAILRQLAGIIEARRQAVENGCPAKLVASIDQTIEYFLKGFVR